MFYGIEIDNFNISKVKISRLYIKLDKKLIVNAKKIHINFKNSKKNSNLRLKELNDILKKLPWLDYVFEQIDIQDMYINGNNIKLLYKDDIFKLETDNIALDANIQNHKKSDLKLTINHLKLKHFDLKLKGTLVGNLKAKEAILRGRFKGFGIYGDLVMHLKKEILTYMLSTNKFYDLEPLMSTINEKIKIPKKANDWIYKKVKAKEYHLISLEGKVNIYNGKFFPKQIKAKIKAKNITVKFHKNLAPATVEEADLKLLNNNLYFKLKKPKYKKIALDGTKGHIYKLLTKGNGLILHIKANTPLSKDIQNILKIYKINIPITQKTGYTDVKLDLNIRFVPYNIDIKGDFGIKNSTLLISKVPFYSKNTKINLDNKVIKLKNVNLSYKDIFKLDTNATLNQHKNGYKGNIELKHLSIKKEKNNLLELANQNLPLDVNITKNNFTAHMPNLSLLLKFAKDENEIYIKDISKLKPNSDIMKKFQVDGGEVLIKTKDFLDFKINAHISKIKPIFKINDLNITSFDATINANKWKTTLKTKKDFLKLLITENKTKIYINNADVLVDVEDKEKGGKNTTIQGKNSNFYIIKLNKKILFDNYNIDLTDKSVKFKGNYENGNISAFHTKERLQVDGVDLNSVFVNTFLGKDMFKEGNFSLKIVGKDVNNLTGHIHITNTFVKSFSFYSQLLAYMNSVPNLMTFKKQGFSEKGFFIKDADILFYKKADTVKIYNIDIKSPNANVYGTGVYNAKSDKIDLKLKLKTFKGVSDIIGKIPMINYIFLGKDNSIETYIVVKGKISKPEIKTQTAKELSLVPFNIIKRTLQMPFELFSDNNTKNK